MVFLSIIFLSAFYLVSGVLKGEIVNVLVQVFGVVSVVSGFGLLGALIAGAPIGVFLFGLPIFILALIGWFITGALDL
jgi:uncharacterized membrane protein